MMRCRTTATIIGNTADRSVIVHGTKLLELARLFGLSQRTIAETFGVNRAQVHRWSQGVRPIPTERLEPLLHLVYDAGRRFLASGQADLWDVEPAEPSLRGLTSVQVQPPLHVEIERLLSEIIVENLEWRGEGPSASIQELGKALAPYFVMDQATLRKHNNSMELFGLSTQLTIYAEMLVRLGPLFELATPATGDEENPCRP